MAEDNHEHDSASKNEETVYEHLENLDKAIKARKKLNAEQAAAELERIVERIMEFRGLINLIIEQITELEQNMKKLDKEDGENTEKQRKEIGDKIEGLRAKWQIAEEEILEYENLV